MKRREFITLLGGVAAAWPLVARAQQGERMRRVGVLTNLSSDDPDAQARIGAFLQGLQEFGWAVGRNVRIDYRWGGGDAERTRKHAAELVALAPDVILTSGGTAVAPLLQATRSVPIVFAQVPDPVGAGYVRSLARPGGYATGFTQFEYGIAGKWLELLKEIAPPVTRAVVIRDPAITAGIGMFGAIQSAAPSLGVEVSPVNVRDPSEMERGITAFARFGNGSLGKDAPIHRAIQHVGRIASEPGRRGPSPPLLSNLVFGTDSELSGKDDNLGEGRRSLDRSRNFSVERRKVTSLELLRRSSPINPRTKAGQVRGRAPRCFLHQSLDEASPMQLTRCRWRLDGFRP